MNFMVSSDPDTPSLIAAWGVLSVKVVREAMQLKHVETPSG